jgi:hypothetical protein
MGGMGGDPGDGNDSSELADLEQRVSAIEAKLGMSSPANEQETNPVAPPMPAMKQVKKPGGAMPFLGVKG